MEVPEPSAALLSVNVQYRSMKLRFKDRMGETGVVDEDLEVEYSGLWEQEVRDVVHEAREDTPEDTLYDPSNPLSYLVMKLPEEVPITEVGREDTF